MLIVFLFVFRANHSNSDLAQFYNSFKLGANQWNLQRFLWLDDLDPDGELIEGVILTLIYGVKSSVYKNSHKYKLLT